MISALGLVLWFYCVFCTRIQRTASGSESALGASEGQVNTKAGVVYSRLTLMHEFDGTIPSVNGAIYFVSYADADCGSWTSRTVFQTAAIFEADSYYD